MEKYPIYDKLASYISRRLFSSQIQALNVKTKKKKKKEKKKKEKEKGIQLT